jgi:hypothetical protein
MGQIYLSAAEFVSQHQPNHVIRDVPHRQTQATRPSLRVLFHGKQSEAKAIHLGYRRDGYRLAAIAKHLADIIHNECCNADGAASWEYPSL